MFPSDPNGSAERSSPQIIISASIYPHVRQLLLVAAFLHRYTSYACHFFRFVQPATPPKIAEIYFSTIIIMYSFSLTEDRFLNINHSFYVFVRLYLEIAVFSLLLLQVNMRESVHSNQNHQESCLYYLYLDILSLCYLYLVLFHLTALQRARYQWICV